MRARARARESVVVFRRESETKWGPQAAARVADIEEPHAARGSETLCLPASAWVFTFLAQVIPTRRPFC